MALQILITVGAVVAILFASLLLLLWHLLGEKRFNTDSQGSIITQLINGTLVPNAVGVVKLPASLASTTEDGNVYVTVDASGTTWILFSTWRGKGDNISGYVYHNTPTIGAALAQIKLNGPDLMNVATSIDYMVDAKIDASWYHVVWNMD